MILALALVISSGAVPQQDSAAFITRFVAAVNSGSVAQRRALQHPQDTCAAIGFVEEIVLRQSQNPIDRDHEWRITPIPSEPLPFQGMIDYTVRPTHQLQISFNSTPTRSRTLVARLARSASGWHEVHGCPTAEVLARMDSVNRNTEQRRREVGRRINTMRNQLRDSILALHLNGRIVTATSYYAADASLDRTTAYEVVDSVIARHRLLYKYAYPHNTRTLVENHYIVIDTIDGQARGWYYGTTDDFDGVREGYQPGFFVAPMHELRFVPGAIAFSLTLEPDWIFTDPVPLTIRDSRLYGASRWRVTPLSGTRAYSGTVGVDSIVFQLERERRGFRRVR